jgi:hypothetical protein
MADIFGPSMAIDPARYRARYGSEDDILAIQNRMLLKSEREIGVA